MTVPTPPVSDVLRGIEELAARSGEMLAEALSLIEQAARAEAAAMETAVAALGESHARTVVDLARMPVAAEVTRVLLAIRSSADAMLSGTRPSSSIELPPAPSAGHHGSLVRSSSVPHPDASGRIDLYGIMVPASRSQEASEVVAAARTAVAQNRKANPYDHYRGKNSWCKSLFLAAFAEISTEASRVQVDAAPALYEDAAPAVSPRLADVAVTEVEARPAVAPRPSIAGSGPLRGARHAAGEPSQMASRPAAAASPARLHAQGITAQTIEDPGTSRQPPQQASNRPTRSFFKQRTR
jgi:hypothetical protein